jgi:hypothetical protein
MTSKEYFYETPLPANILGEEYTVEYQGKEELLVAPKLPVYKVKNFSISSGKADKPLIISGQTVILTITNGGLWGYFHLIHNILSEIELIKKLYPKTQIKVLQLCEEGDFDYFVRELKRFGIFDAYKLSDLDIIDLTTTKSLIIEELLFMYTEYNYLANRIANKTYNYLDGTETFNSYNMLYSNKMKKRFVSGSTENKDRKIFISRVKSGGWLREISFIIHKKVLGHSITEEENEKIQGIDPSEYREYADRPMSEKDEIRLEKLFEEAGYEIIDPGIGNSIQEQAELFNSAKYIVGLSGAGMVNCCFCSKDTKVLVLNTSDSYRFPHKEIVQSFGLMCEEAPAKKPWAKGIYRSQEIFDSVESSYPEFLV